MTTKLHTPLTFNINNFDASGVCVLGQSNGMNNNVPRLKFCFTFLCSTF